MMKSRRDGIRLFNTSSGFSVVEAMIGCGLLILFFMMHVNSYVQVEKARKAQYEAHSRMRLFQGLINIMALPTTLRVSSYHAGKLSMLNRCVTGWAGSCPSPTMIRDIKLLLPPLSSSGSTAELSGPFTGPPSAPMFYNNEGEACDSSVTTCPVDEYPIAVATQYNTVCPPRTDSTYVYPPAPWQASDLTDHMNPEGIQVRTDWCSRAHYIKIHYRFYPRVGAPQFKEVSGTLMVNAPAANFSF